MIDLYSYLEGKTKTKKEAFDIYKQNFSVYTTGYGRLPKVFIEFVSKNYLKGKLENVSPRTLYHKDEYGDRYISDGRNSGRYPWVRVEPVNIFSDNVELYFPKCDFKTTDEAGKSIIVKAGEHIHRYAFMHGAIRLTLGLSSDGKHGNKVIYIGKRNDPAKEYKIPYTIPYGKTMSRY